MSVNAPNDKLQWEAPKFKLKNIDNIYYSLDDLRGVNGTVIAFICNHCPYVLSIAERLKFEADQLSKKNIKTIAIMSNDINQYPEDSYENMILFSKKYNFNFPYLYDETQETAKKYGAVCTPDIFGFDTNLILQYRGRIDSGVMNSNSKNIVRELYNAMIEVMLNGVAQKKQFNSFGCSIKWINHE
tara:strand:+ start:383 stop:940 length:558 start_codon:yes stop_codon:yes gene_type:complete